MIRVRRAVAVLAGCTLVALGTEAGGEAAPTAATDPSPVEATGREQRLYMITDSVGLGAAPAIRSTFAGWQVTIDADAGEFTDTLERKYVAPRLSNSPGVFGDHAIVATGYNYPYWDPARFDRSVDSMIATLERAGVRHVHWVTLREVRPQDVSPAAWRGAAAWRWYLATVNDHLEAALERHPNLTLVDWAAVADQPGITYDAIHLNNPGAALYASIVRQSVADTTTRLPDGGVLRVAVPDAAGIGAVAVNVTTTAPRSRGFLTAWNCEGPPPTASFHNHVRGEVVARSTIVPINATGEFCISTRVATNVIVDLTGRFPVGGGYRPVGPIRWADTRGSGSRVASGGTLTLDLADVPGVDPTGAGAVAIGLTATGASGPGFLTAAATCGAGVSSSNVNYRGGDTIPNLVIVEPDAQGRICVFALTETDVVVDVVGVFDATGEVNADIPVRVHDSRTGRGPWPAGATYEVQLDGVAASAAVLNVTAVGASRPGFLAAFPCDRPSADSSLLNMAGPGAVSNATIVAPDATNRVCVRTSIDTDLVVDVMGTFGAGFVGGAPKRLVDTRAA